MFGSWGSSQVSNPTNPKRGFFSFPKLSNPFASYPQVQQPVAVPVPVPVQVPASQLNVNSVYANNQPADALSSLSSFNELHSKYYDLENERFTYKKKYNSKKQYNKIPTAENEAAVRKATNDVEQFLINLPPGSINYISEYEGNLLSGISFLSIASRFMSSIGIKTLCEMGAKTDIIDDSGRSLAEAADADAKRLKKMGLNPTEFIATVKQYTAAKGGRRSVRPTKKVHRKRRHSSRRR